MASVQISLYFIEINCPPRNFDILWLQNAQKTHFALFNDMGYICHLTKPLLFVCTFKWTASNFLLLAKLMWTLHFIGFISAVEMAS